MINGPEEVQGECHGYDRDKYDQNALHKKQENMYIYHVKRRMKKKHEY